jgi:hypothetical protein
MTTRLLAVLILSLAFVAGCGGSKSNNATTSSSSSAVQQPSASQQQQQQAAPGLVIDVSISNGNVNPTNGEFKAKVGQPIQLRVNSDAPDQLHIHSVPDHTFQVEPKRDQIFQFTVDVPGTVEVELHKLDRTIGTIQVTQ